MANGSLLTSLIDGSGSSSLGSASSLTIQTNFTPALTFAPGAGGSAQQTGGATLPALLNPLYWLQPSFTLTAGGVTLPTVAPYGVPDGNYLPRLVVLGAGLAGLGLVASGARAAAKTALYVALAAGAYVLLTGGSLPGLSQQQAGGS